MRSEGDSHEDIWAGAPGKWEQCWKGRLGVREESAEAFLQRRNLLDLGFNRFTAAMTVLRTGCRGGGGEKQAHGLIRKLLNSQMAVRSSLIHSGSGGGGVSDLILDVF